MTMLGIEQKLNGIIREEFKKPFTMVYELYYDTLINRIDVRVKKIEITPKPAVTISYEIVPPRIKPYFKFPNTEKMIKLVNSMKFVKVRNDILLASFDETL